MSWAAGLAIACLAASTALAQEAAPPAADAEVATLEDEPLAGGADAAAPVEQPPEGEAGAAKAAADALAVPTAAATPGPTASADPVYERLLGSEPPEPAPTVAPVSSIEPLSVAPPWLWAVLIVTAAGLLWLRSRVGRPPGGGPALRVVGRSLLGREGSLAVVEVDDGGRTRRMLIGYGGGSPRLVAELADGGTSGTAPQPAGRGFGAALRRSLGGSAAVPAPASPAPSSASAETGDAPGLRSRDDLIAEVLAERSTVVDGDWVAGGPEDDEDDPSAETYTFRGLLG